MKLHLALESIDSEGTAWKANFERTWSSYTRWYLGEGRTARPRYRTCIEALKAHMPELMPTYEKLCDLAGAGDLAARFLSLYRPPPYMTGCTQAIWTRGGSPMLVRNYDYEVRQFEGRVFHSQWLKPVIGVSDCAWGLLDGMNADGLCASLTFGGSQEVRRGFGIPLVIRYVLETCSTVEEALKVFQRIPVHMAYNVSLLDRSGSHRTLYLTAGGGVNEVSRMVCANHQEQVFWPEYETATSTREREAFADAALNDPSVSREQLIQSFLSPPLHIGGGNHALHTLYTSIWEPTNLSVRLVWPGSQLSCGFSPFEPQEVTIDLED
jgi:predicted choloylglycine hydrolase